MIEIHGWEIKSTQYGVVLTKDGVLYLLVHPSIWNSPEWNEKEIEKYLYNNMKPIQDEERSEIVQAIITASKLSSPQIAA